jgi:hypothetical protein
VVLLPHRLLLEVHFITLAAAAAVAVHLLVLAHLEV